jgi:hypothetical protein
MIAEALGLQDDELREFLRAEMQRRRRERGEARDGLDRTLEMRDYGR